MNFWTIENLRAATGGTFLARPAKAAGPIQGVSTDSRGGSVLPGQVFVAIKGERHDGHSFVAEAARAGAAVMVVEREVALPADVEGVCVLRVVDTRKALGRLAAAYRKTLGTMKVVAVCGSNGKTTTVRMIHAVLGTKLRGTAALRSYNNEIGVPLTLLAARSGDQYVVCEVGTNAPGEIAGLGKLVEPDVAPLNMLFLMGRPAVVGRRAVAAVRTRLLAAARTW